MRASIVFVLALAVSAALLVAQARTAKTLDVYVVDVEGGSAVLYVGPSGENLLIDTGGLNGRVGAVRDAERIVAAAKDAGVTQIDNLIITHWHIDHFGGLAELAARIPIEAFYDHGASVQAGLIPEADEFLQKVYPALTAKAKHTIVKPGGKIPVAGLDVHVVSAAGQVIKTPLPGAGRPNPYCASFKPHDPDPTENGQSVGSYITFGKFRVVQLGDLTWNKEFDLMCPSNRLGTADLFIVSQHGGVISNSEVLVHAIQPRVSITNNGTRKGGQPEAMRIIFNSPGLEDVWQMHFSLLGGQEYTVPGMFIANMLDEPQTTMPVTPAQGGQQGGPVPQHNGKAYYFKVSAQQDGTFTVTNTRNNFTKTYKAGTRLGTH